MTMHTVAIHFSIIIPAYNEERLLPRLLNSIEVARSNYSGGREAVEVIVADNSSTDRTTHIAAAHGCRVIQVAKRSIAATRNGGARVACGETFCFIDADSEIHPQTFDAIREALSNTNVIAGTTGLHLERQSPGLLVAFYFLKMLTWATKIDAGVVFCGREDFLAVGGYNENLLYAEDVAFLLALKRRGRTSGRKLACLKGVEALGSSRKFDEHGDWHYFSLFFRAGLSLIRGKVSSQKFADSYWYKPKR
jgi:glycosyltransferase involved in cell wall biosynthesis